MRSPLSPPKSAGYNPLSAAKSLFGSPSKQGYQQLKEGEVGSPSLSPYRLPQSPPMGVLEVHVQCADGLRAADSNGKSDPYAKVRVGRHKGQTKAVAKSLDPRWDERLLFPGTLADFIEETLTIKVRDKDKGSFDDPLGEVNVRLGALDGLKRGSSRIDFAHQALQPEIPAGGRRGSLSGKPAPPPTGTISFTVSWLPDRGGGGGGGGAREQTSASGPGLDAEALQALVDAPAAPGRPPAAHPPAAGTRKSSLPPRAHQPQAPPGFTWLG